MRPTRFSGPVLYSGNPRVSAASLENLPIGLNPDYAVYFDDFQGIPGNVPPNYNFDALASGTFEYAEGNSLADGADKLYGWCQLSSDETDPSQLNSGGTVMTQESLQFRGQELFIEALNLVKIELGYEAFHVVILGSDQGRDLYKKKLIRLTEQYRLTNQIKFINHCKDMALAYKISDIVVSASIEPEAFGRVAVEAQSMEKLIIASNIGGSNETIVNGKTGILFESGDVNSLSKKIIEAITMDETSIKLMGKEGRKNIIKKFNVEKMCFFSYLEHKRLLN